MAKANLEKELKNNQTNIILMESIEYNDLILETAKKLAHKSVCYITLNKTYDSLLELLKKKKVNVKNIIFIDAISKTLKPTPDQIDNCYFVSSPAALTELSIVISKILKHEFEYLIFDSITNLAIYENKNTIAKFMTALINKIKETKTRAVFYAVQSKEQEDLIKQCCTMSDNTIEL